MKFSQTWDNNPSKIDRRKLGSYFVTGYSSVIYERLPAVTVMANFRNIDRR